MSESQLIEYKESWRDEYLKWICGFANAQGGTLYIGKRDDGSVCGVADSKKLMEDIPNKVRDALGLIVDVDLITENGLDVIETVADISARVVVNRVSMKMKADELRPMIDKLKVEVEKMNQEKEG